MKMRMGESQFGAPNGVYTGEFLGVFPFEGNGQRRLGKDGRPMPPAVEWRFAIVEDPDHGGEFIGREVSRITSEQPTAKNSCGQLLAGLLGRPVSKDEEVDTVAYEGRHFRVTLGPSKENADRTQVVAVSPLPATASSAPNSSPPKPPPRPTAKKPPSRPAPQTSPVRYWVQRSDDGEADLLGPHEISAWVAETGADPADVPACVEDAGPADWKTLAAFGFKKGEMLF